MNMKIEVDVLTVLSNIDEMLGNESLLINKKVTNESLPYNSEIFDFWISKEDEDYKKIGKPGIYVFKMKDECPLNEFDSVEYAPKTNAELNGESFVKNDILYLGKSESNLAKRLEEHIKGPSSKKTYALRLNDSKREHIIGNFDLYCFILKDKFNRHSKLILSTVESYLHDNLKPKVGSKRA